MLLVGLQKSVYMKTQSESVTLVGDAVTTNLARAALFAALTGAFAYVSFPSPLSPVPITLQVMGVFLAGVYLGPVWGGLSMAVYLGAGAVGAPIFSGGTAGIGPLLGFTGGHLWSYPLAAALIGFLAHGPSSLSDPQKQSTVRLIGAMVAGTVLIYTLGTVGFAIVQNVGLIDAFLVSAVAFIPFEAIKMAATIGIVRNEHAVAN